MSNHPNLCLKLAFTKDHHRQVISLLRSILLWPECSTYLLRLGIGTDWLISCKWTAFIVYEFFSFLIPVLYLPVSILFKLRTVLVRPINPGFCMWRDWAASPRSLRDVMGNLINSLQAFAVACLYP
jgi:hypothetical protein